MSFFELTVPARGNAPVLVEVPHAGLAIPDEVRGELDVSPAEVLRDADIYVDLLCEQAPARGASMLTARVSRYVVDLNRAPDDVDSDTVDDHPAPRGIQPRGVVWRLTTEGRPVLQRRLRYDELLARLDRFHAPYHQTLRRELERMRDRYGYAVLLAAHSMPSVGRTGHADTGSRRADVVPGTRGRSTADGKLIELIDSHFRGAGLSVAHDNPYRGGWTTGHYGRPGAGWHAVQIELNRALYVHESTGRPKVGEFEQLQQVMGELVSKVVEFRP
jgi:N-formylglutamate amidohydrolase